MKRYRILSNGESYKIQRKTIFWFDVLDQKDNMVCFDTIKKANDHIKELRTKEWKVVEMVEPEQKGNKHVK